MRIFIYTYVFQIVVHETIDAVMCFIFLEGQVGFAFVFKGICRRLTTYFLPPPSLFTYIYILSIPSPHTNTYAHIHIQTSPLFSLNTPHLPQQPVRSTHHLFTHPPPSPSHPCPHPPNSSTSTNQFIPAISFHLYLHSILTSK